MLDIKDGKSLRMSKRNIVILGVVLLLAVVSVITIVVSLRGGGGEADPYKSESSQTQTESEKQTPQPTETNNQDSNQPAAQTPTIDPASISEIDIPAFGITVSYLKDIPGFSYTIQRAANNTEYVEFTSDQLVSNRCTDDKGVFATIIKNAQPGADSATVSSTTKVGAVTYGLSLAAETCAADKALLQTYQKSFKDAFPLLKASTSNQ